MANLLNNITELDNENIAHSVHCDVDDLLKHIIIKQKDLTILSQNIRSIYCNFDSFLVSLESLKIKVDIIVLTECWLNSKKLIPQIEGYTCFSTKNHLNQSDGVVMFINNSLNLKVKEIKLNHASCIQIQHGTTTILGIYRSPSNPNADIFLGSLETHLDNIKAHKSVILVGDININLTPKQTETSQERQNRLNYLNNNMMSTKGLLPGHVFHTRETRCLDQFFLKINKSVTTANIAVLG